MKTTFKLNKFSKPEENNTSLFRRLFIYQKERFPLLGHGLLITAFSFSAISYSRICRQAAGFVSWDIFLPGIFITITIFMLLRIFDEFKDAKDDDAYRPELPVPRGLVSLKELSIAGIIIFLLQLITNLFFFPKMLLIFAVVIAWLLLMGKEFFIAEWLKKNQFWYVVSHMMIIPLTDVYASGLDWFLAGVSPPAGLIFFFIVSFMNGVVLEVGRKIRAPEKEAPGVITYTSLLGKRAVWLWIAVLFGTLVFAIAAGKYAGYGLGLQLALSFIFFICTIPGLAFLHKPGVKNSKMIEYASALWTISMYFILGGGPMITSMFFK